jgi:hypothetical protein
VFFYGISASAASRPSPCWTGRGLDRVKIAPLRGSVDGLVQAWPTRPMPAHGAGGALVTFLRREVNRHGAVVWYVRKGEGQRVRIRAAFGTPQFDTEYQAALNVTPRPVKGGTTAGNIVWLIERYQETAAWAKLSRASQRQRQNMLAQVIKAAGNRAFTDITKLSLEAARDRRSAAQGRKFLDVMRGLFRWAAKAGIAKVDPTAGIANPRAEKTAGFHV